jgi:AcrR family transcriptional regulator
MSPVSQAEVQPDRQALRRAARREQSRTEILDAAEQVFGEYGIHDGSLRKIADQSGFSPAAIYLFFDNKQHLLAETLTRRSDELIKLTRAAAEQEVTPLDQLHRFIDVAIDFFAERPYFGLLLRHLRGGPTITWPVLVEFAEDVHRRYLDSMKLLARIIEDGQAVGQIREGDGFSFAHLYMVLITEFILLGAESNESKGGALTPEQFHAFVDGSFRKGGP